MESITLWGIFILFVLAWIAPILLVVHYRCVTISARFDEIRDALLARDEDDKHGPPAPHYLRLFTRKNLPKNATLRDLDAAIHAHLVQFHDWSRYAFSLFLVATFSAAALYFVWSWATQTFTGTSPFGPIAFVLPQELVFAFTGAYIWSLYEMADRARRKDLTPDELYDVAIRYLFALPIGYAGTLLSVDAVDSAFAFAVSAFPLRDLRRIVRKRALGRMKAEPTTRAEPKIVGYLGDVVAGLSPDTRARLEEIDIVTFTDLAYADPIRIMVKTGFSLRHIIQWIDHAQLAIYAFDHKKKLAENGVSCALDAKEFYEMHFFEKPSIEGCPVVTAVADRVGIPAVVLKEIFMRVAIDPHVLFLATMWYTGYREGRPGPESCEFHKP